MKRTNTVISLLTFVSALWSPILLAQAPKPKPVVLGPVAIGCVHKLCVAVDAKGQLFYYEMDKNNWEYRFQAPGLSGPSSISCDAIFVCVIVNQKGETWRGDVRGMKTFEKTGTINP